MLWPYSGRQPADRPCISSPFPIRHACAHFGSLLDMKPALYRIAKTLDVLIIVSFLSLGETMREGAR